MVELWLHNKDNSKYGYWLEQKVNKGCSNWHPILTENIEDIFVKLDGTELQENECIEVKLVEHFKGDSYDNKEGQQEG